MKAFFIDADGTLLDLHSRIPQSAKDEIARVQKAGHKVFLCTGRQVCQVYGQLATIPYDGMVNGAGCHVEAGGRTLLEQTFTKQDLDFLLAYANAHNLPILLECTDSLYLNEAGKTFMEGLLEQILPGLDEEEARYNGTNWIYTLAKPLPEGADLPASKLCFFDAPVPFAQIESGLQDRFSVVPTSYPLFGESSGEVSVKGCSKGTGLELIASHLGIPLSDCIAIGDSWNDLAMLEAAGNSAVVANAPEAVKEKAGFVGPAMEDGGVAAILRHFCPAGQ